MKKITHITLLAVLVFTGVLIARQPAQAGMAVKVHQNCDHPVNDLHYRIYPNEPWVYILNWNITVSGFGNPAVTVTPIRDPADPQKRIHWLDVDAVWQQPVPYCTWITINNSLLLTEFNALVVDNIFWTFNGVRVCPAFTDQGFTVDFIAPASFMANSGFSTYWFHNKSDDVLAVKDFKYAKNQDAYMEPEEILYFTEWTDFVGDFTVPPEASYAIPLEGMEPEKFLYIRMELYEAGSAYNSDLYLGPVAEIHEDQAEPGQSVNIEELGLLEEVKFLNVASSSEYSEISYQLPKATHATLIVYSLAGEKITTLVDEVQPAGGHTVIWDGDDAPAGLYICHLSADGILAAEKMVRLK